MKAMVDDWNSQIARINGAHFLQSSHWAAIKSSFGWLPHFLCWQDEGSKVSVREWTPGINNICAAALILERSVSVRNIKTGLNFFYAPKGPVLDWENASLVNQVLSDLVTFTKNSGSFTLKIDPDIIKGKKNDFDPRYKESNVSGIESLLLQNGWLPSKEQIQFRNTVLIDLTPDEDTLLMNMKQKTRYNIRVASRKGILIRKGTGNDFPLLYQMFAKTSLRDGFVIRESSYYYTVWSSFLENGMADILIAEYQQVPVAAVIVIKFANKAWYVYGMSLDSHREKMPNYILQWEAIKKARESGCRTYDLWGAPDELIPTDPMWGVYRFKEGLGGLFTKTLGAWDYPANIVKYKAFNSILPKIMSILRNQGFSRTQNLVQ